MSTPNSRLNRAAVLAQVQAIIAGTQKHFPNGSFTFENTAYTTATLVQDLQTLANAITDTNAAHARDQDAVKALKVTQTKLGPLLRDYRRYVISAFTAAPQTLVDFGLQPPKARTPKTTEQKAAAVAKMRATRAARGTASKKQKLAVKGDVTGVTITPVTHPAVTSPAATPAEAAPAVHAPASTTK
jgi:hypothetical protein